MDGPAHAAESPSGKAGAAADDGAPAATGVRGVDRQALIERISELEDGAKVKEAIIRKEVKAEIAKLDAKLINMPPDKALKHLRAVHQTALISVRTKTANIATKQTELDKTLAVRSKLETLCRELQRQNRAVADESKRAQEAELKKREQLSKQFQGTINEISSRLEADEQAKAKQMEDHDQLRVKLDQLAQQNAGRTEQFQKLLEAKDLEVQLLTAKLAHQEQLTLYEAKKGEGMAVQIEQLRENETVIKGEFVAYGQKYETLNTALTESAAAFETYKKEIETSRKEIAKLSKESLGWKKRYDKVNAALVVSKQNEVKVSELMRKNTTLEKLCRALRQGNVGGGGADPADNSAEGAAEPQA